LINGVVSEVGRLLDEGAVVLIPPGSSRGKIVKRLHGIGTVAYRKLTEELAKYHIDVEEMRAKGSKLLVGDKSLVEYIREKDDLSKSLHGKY